MSRGVDRYAGENDTTSATTLDDYTFHGAAAHHNAGANGLVVDPHTSIEGQPLQGNLFALAVETAFFAPPLSECRVRVQLLRELAAPGNSPIVRVNTV